MASTESFTQVIDNRFVSRVILGPSFATNREVLDLVLTDDPHSTNGGLAEFQKAALIESLPKQHRSIKRRDTFIGGNDAINSYYQFNEDDDIIHSLNRTGNGPNDGMGRVYNEQFDQQQQLLYLSFGIPDYANAGTFIKNVYNAKLATLMNTGESSMIEGIGKVIGLTLGHVVALPIAPIRFVLWMLNKVTQAGAPTKYYDFLPSMSLYYKMVNVILAHIGTNMGLVTMIENGTNESVVGVPNIIQRHGLDILSILNRKDHYGTSDNMGEPATEQQFAEFVKNSSYEKNMWADIAGKVGEGLGIGFTEAMRYVGFRIEKTTNSEESCTNNTKEPEILNAINAQVSAGRDRTFSLSGLKETAVGGFVNNIYKAVTGVAEGILDSVGIEGVGEMVKGSGFVDIPEIWNSSQFQKSYTFDFQLRTPYGDPFSIFYSLYIPLAMMLAGAFPRAVGQNSYTSPFLVRAYCQGMFAIPLGIIDSIHIKRGAAEYGWNKDMLPTQIDISFTIKDLSPVMAVALSDGSMTEWFSIFGQNSTFQEYMLTLGATNIAERTLKMKLANKRSDALRMIMANNKFNPMMFGFSLTNNFIGRMITRITPVSRLPGMKQPNG